VPPILHDFCLGPFRQATESPGRMRQSPPGNRFGTTVTVLATG